MDDWDTLLLSRAAANHLILGQLEPLRATLLSLRHRNPDLARSFLESSVAAPSRFPDSALLAHISLLELLRFPDPAAIWPFSAHHLRLRVEFVLHVQQIASRASGLRVLDKLLELGFDRLRPDSGSSSGLVIQEEKNASWVSRALDSQGLEKLSELGLNSVKPDSDLGSDSRLVVQQEESASQVLDSTALDKLSDLGLNRVNLDSGLSSGLCIEEGEINSIRGLVLENVDLFHALCVNIQKQIGGDEGEGDDDLRVLRLVQREVQVTHLDAIRACLVGDDVEEASSHVRFLHLGFGVEESEYRMVLQDLLKGLLSNKGEYGEKWFAMRERLLSIYREALSSSCTYLIQMIQVIHDELLIEEIEVFRKSDNNDLPPPLEHLRRLAVNLKPETNSNENDSSLKIAASSCMRDMYHYARVSGLHILECVMDAALSAVKREQLQEASTILSLFPRLQPLVAAMGWDLLSGKTTVRRKLMQVLWTSKSQVLRLEESSLYGNQLDEVSAVEHLCDSLCYQLDIASFVACVNSGQPWSSKSSILLSRKEPYIIDNYHYDPFVENFVLERLSVQGPLRVLFDVVPGIKFQDAIELISMQPMTSTLAAWKRMEDIELVHMRYALEFAVLALGSMERTDETGSHDQMALCFLKDLRSHLEAISILPRKILMVNIVISLLHMDDLALNLTQCLSAGSHSESSNLYTGQHAEILEGGNKIVISFVGLLLDILRQNLPSTGCERDSASTGNLPPEGVHVLDWRILNARRFIEDWEWRLSILQQLLPLSERQWRWKEAMTVLRAAPSKLLNLCMQRAKYEIGEEAVHRFRLPPEDKVTLELAEWVDGAFRRASVEDAVSRAANGTTAVQDIDFFSLRAQIGPLAAILLCIDVATSSAKSASMSQKLLDQAQIMLSEIFPGGAPKSGSTYWDQIHEVGIISVARRVLKRLHEILEQDKPPVLQDIFCGEITSLSPKELSQQHRERALAMLQQMIEDAHMGKRQFLSGKLHNVARAIADEEMEKDYMKGDGSHSQGKLINSEKEGILGLGLRAQKNISLSSTAGENNVQQTDATDPGKRMFGPLNAKPTTHLSQFILHIAAIGDIVDGTDTTHDFNYFSLVYEWPKDLLTRLVFERGSTDAAGKVAEIMYADFVHEVISACVPPVYPPRSGQGWACIPVTPTSPKSLSESKVLSPTSRDAKPNTYRRSSSIPGIPLYPLQLDIVKHLVKISPVRAVLACVFGSGILYRGSDSTIGNYLNDGLLQAPDDDRLFYEFALDQSERFPTLNRWIQMQTNLHRVAEFAVTAERETEESIVKSEMKTAIKRVRELDSDTESEIEDIAVGANISTDLNISAFAASDSWHDSPKSGVVDLDSRVFLSFDWENEGPYEKAIERLIDEGKLMDALAVSDRCLRSGASDRLLQLLIEHGEENNSLYGQSQGFPVHNTWNNSWQYCLRLKDKKLAARLALKYLHRWELDAALDVIIMCSCHLPDGDPIKNEVVRMRQALLRYKHILCADDHYSSWQEVEVECQEDPEGLSLRLAGKGAVSAALEVAESAGLSIDLRRELQGRQLVKLLVADPLNGGGPAEASRFLSSLRDTDDALPVAMGAMQLLPNLRSKQLLVHFFLKRKDGNLSDSEILRLNSWALGLRVLAALPLPWQQRCSSLHEHPHLILEVLLMRKQLQSASQILKEFPSLRGNSLILKYAAKAIAVTVHFSSREPRISVSGPRSRQKTKTGAPTRSSFTNSLSNLQKEARRAFSWTPRNNIDKNAPKETYRKRKSSGLAPSERVAWEAMTGIQEDRVSSYPVDGQERLPSISIAEEWMLTGDLVKDDVVRASHQYESAPDNILFRALLSLCSDELVSAKGAVDLCINQMKTVLSSQQLPVNASTEIIGRAYHATEAFVQGLLFAKAQLRKIPGGGDLPSNERGKDADDESSDAGSPSVGSQSTDELSDVSSQADIWLGRAELLQSLLGSGIAAALDDIADEESSGRLRDRLILDEKYSMAVYTCRKCKIDVFPVWNAWGHALIRMEHYAQARVKFKQALQLYKGDTAPVILDIINTIEGGPPVDVSAVRSMYEHLAKSAPAILDDSLSADSYLNVLYMPSTFPRKERYTRFLELASDDPLHSLEYEDEPRSNLDSIRYLECVNYFQEYARQHLLGFMFRHGYYKDACLLFFPPDAVPPPPEPSLIGVATSTSPQRLDPLAIDYGTIDDLCDLCMGYGAMPVLEEVLSTRISPMPQDLGVKQHTAAALARICAYCESHRHFNYLYRFQVIKKDHVAAGLCCIQLFMNSSSLEIAIKHLENAKMHFDEGLSARFKTGDSTKLITKGTRGKSASEKLTEEGLVKFSARIAIQVDVVKSFNETDGPQWKYSVFGNPNDPETFRRRCKIAETLAEKNFDLAFQVIYEFNLPAVDIYAGVAASLAERKRGGQLTEFFRNIKGTIDEDDWDQVLGAAINVYANKHKERPDRLIDMLTSSHRKVLACVVCGRLKSAFQIASRSGSVADVQYVAHQALHANALPVLDMCKQWLAQYM